MEAVWAALADSEVEAGRGEEQLLTTVTSSVAAVALLAEVQYCARARRRRRRTDSETQTAFAATARELTQHIHSVSSIDFLIRFFLQQF